MSHLSPKLSGATGVIGSTKMIRASQHLNDGDKTGVKSLNLQCELWCGRLYPRAALVWSCAVCLCKCVRISARKTWLERSPGEIDTSQSLQLHSVLPRSRDERVVHDSQILANSYSQRCPQRTHTAAKTRAESTRSPRPVIKLDSPGAATRRRRRLASARTLAGHSGWWSESGACGQGLVTSAPGRLRENARPAL